MSVVAGSLKKKAEDDVAFNRQCPTKAPALLAKLLSFFFFKQKTAYEMVRSDWSSDVCSSDLRRGADTRKATIVAEDLGDHTWTGTMMGPGMGEMRSEERRVGKGVSYRVDL